MFSGDKVLIHLSPEEAKEIEDCHIKRAAGAKAGLEFVTLEQVETA
jgi:hypothetical protein